MFLISVFIYIYFSDHTFNISSILYIFENFIIKLAIFLKTILKDLIYVICKTYFNIYKDILFYIEYIKNNSNFSLDTIIDFINFIFFAIKTAIILINIVAKCLLFFFYCIIVFFIETIYDYLSVSDINPLLYFDIILTLLYIFSVIFLDTDFSKNLEKNFFHLSDSKISFRFHLYLKLLILNLGFTLLYFLYRYKLNFFINYDMLFIWFFFYVKIYLYFAELLFYYDNTFYNKERIDELFFIIEYSICLNIYMFYFFF